jgi:hypothetical protein
VARSAPAQDVPSHSVKMIWLQGRSLMQA